MTKLNNQRALHNHDIFTGLISLLYNVATWFKASTCALLTCLMISQACTAKPMSGFAEYKNTDIYYQVTGQGKKTIVFVHGLPLDSQSWQCQVEHFKKSYRVVTLDLPGYGRSSPLTSFKQKNLSYFYADAVNAVLEKLKIGKATYVGFATGGHVGMAFADRYQNKLEKLVLVNTSPQFTVSADWPYGFDDKAVKQFDQAFANQSMDEIAKTLLDPAMEENCQARLGNIKKTFTQMTKSCGVTTLKAFFNNLAYENFRPLLPKIQVPTLIIQSSLDKEVQPAVALYMRKHIPDAQLVEINGSDHFVFATQKALFNAMLENFLNPQCSLCNYADR